MKMLISHSWNDKTTAMRLKEDLDEIVDVWIDIENLKGGDRIQKEIDETIVEMDMIVLLWSKHAAGSTGVTQEIDRSIELGKHIVPCILDDTKLSGTLEGMISIDFRGDNYAFGYGRLCALMIPYHMGDLGLDLGDTMDSVNTADGILACIKKLHETKRIDSSEYDEWIMRVVNSVEKVTREMKALQGKIKDNASYVKQIYDRLGEAGDDREKVREILYDVIRNEHRDPEFMRKIRAIIERRLDSMPPPKPGLAPLEQAPVREKEAPPGGGSFTRETGSDSDQIRSRLAGLVPPHLLDNLTDHILYYLSATRDTLDVLEQLSIQSSSQQGMLVVHYLQQYLDNPHDLLPESKYGVWGYLDDAWLIHNTAYRLIEAGIIQANVFPVDWGKIAAADQVVTNCLPPMVRGQLENYLMQFLNMIASEIAAYAPRFVGGAQSYHPFMGDAGAVGGPSAESELYADMTDTMCSSIMTSMMDM